MTGRVELRGIEDAIRQIGALPRQVKRAARNSIDGVQGKKQRGVRDRVNKSTGIQKKKINQRMKRFRTRQNDPTSTLEAQPSRFPLGDYKLKKRRVSKTQVAVSASLFIDRGPVEIERVFINPRGGTKKPFRRPAGVGRYPIKVPQGLSMASYLTHLETKDAQLRDTGEELTTEFLDKLDDQIRRGRR